MKKMWMVASVFGVIVLLSSPIVAQYAQKWALPTGESWIILGVGNVEGGSGKQILLGESGGGNDSLAGC